MEDKTVEILKDLEVNLRTSTHYSQDAKALDQAATKIAQLYSAWEEVYVKVLCENELPKITGSYFVITNGTPLDMVATWNKLEGDHDSVKEYMENQKAQWLDNYKFWLKKLTRSTVSEREIGSLAEIEYPSKDSSITKFQRLAFRRGFKAAIKELNR